MAAKSWYFLGELISQIPHFIKNQEKSQKAGWTESIQKKTFLERFSQLELGTSYCCVLAVEVGQLWCGHLMDHLGRGEQDKYV